MSFYNEPFSQDSPQGKELLAIGLIGIQEPKPLKGFVGGLGVPAASIFWEQPVNSIWPDVLKVVAQLGKLRDLLMAAAADPNYVQVLDRIQALMQQCDAEDAAETTAKGLPAPTLAELARTTLVGRRPFVNRVHLRDNLTSLFGEGGDRTMVVGGPPASGRSYTWVLANYVATRVGGFEPKLIDLATFKDTQATPVDVVNMIGATLGWDDTKDDDAKADPTNQDETNARVLLPQLVSRLSKLDGVCLVFDGLDGANLTEATINFVAEIAAAAGNDQLGTCRVILLAFDRALPNPIVDPFVLREPPLGDIPLGELTAYFKSVAAEAGAALVDEQANALVGQLFGTPVPDPVPMSAMRAKAAEVSRTACKLRGV